GAAGCMTSPLLSSCSLDTAVALRGATQRTPRLLSARGAPPAVAAVATRAGAASAWPGEELLQLVEKSRLGAAADDRLGELAAAVDVERRDRDEAVAARDVRVGVDVDLDDLELVAVLRGDLVDDGRHLQAGLAPAGPEVDE